MVYHPHYLSKPPTTARNFRGQKKTHTTPLNNTATSVCHLLGSSIFFPEVTFCFKTKSTTRYTHKKKLTTVHCRVLLPFFHLKKEKKKKKKVVTTTENATLKQASEHTHTHTQKQKQNKTKQKKHTDKNK